MHTWFFQNSPNDSLLTMPPRIFCRWVKKKLGLIHKNREQGGYYLLEREIKLFNSHDLKHKKI